MVSSHTLVVFLLLLDAWLARALSASHCCQFLLTCAAKQAVQQEEVTLSVTVLIFVIFNVLFYYHLHSNNNSNISDNHFVTPPVSNIQT